MAQQRLATILALMLIAIVCGCTEEPKPDPAAQLMRANAELRQKVDAQARMIEIMGGALILMGGAFAIVVAAVWKGGGLRSKHTTPENQGTD